MSTLLDQLLHQATILLEQHVLQGETLSYREFALKLGIQCPPIIEQATRLLELMIDIDCEQHRPLLSAMVVQKRGDIPRQGFFHKIYQIGLTTKILENGEAVEWHQQELKKLKLWVEQ